MLGATLGTSLPGEDHPPMIIQVEGITPPFEGAAGHRVRVAWVEPNYFEPFGAPVRVGRAFDAGDMAESEARVAIANDATGESRVIHGGFSRVRGGSTLTWSRDSRHLFFFALPEGGESRHLIQVSVEDGSVRALSPTPGRIHAISVSPDGRHIAMVTGVTREEIWRMTFNGGG